MPAFADQLDRSVLLPHPPSRIVSLVPSQTELLYTLGVSVIGITKFCVHPEAWYRTKPRVGGTKNIDMGKIAALQPNLIIANKEENDRDQVEALAALYPVWVSDIHNLSDALAMIRAVGRLVGRPEPASILANGIEQQFTSLVPHHPLRTAYLIWRTTRPLSFMAAGGDTFIHDMLIRCGFINHFGVRARYPTVDPGDLSTCDLILLSSEPYPFREEHVAELQTLCPSVTIRLADGECFSWYGSRLLGAPEYFRSLLSTLP